MPALTFPKFFTQRYERYGRNKIHIQYFFAVAYTKTEIGCELQQPK